MKLDLPDWPALFRAARTAGLHIDRGNLPSAEHYRARCLLAGRGDRIGFRATGRIQNFNIMQTVIKGEPVFRDDRTAPRRLVRVIVDLTTNDRSPATVRLMSVAAVVCGATASLADVRVTLVGAGGRSPMGPCPIHGLGELRLAVAGLQRFGDEEPDRFFSPSKLRLVCGQEPEHVVLITHMIKFELLRTVGFPLGCSVFLVKPPCGRVTAAPLGAAGTRFFTDALSAEDDLDCTYEQFVHQARGVLGKVYIVETGGTPPAMVVRAVRRRGS